MGEREGGRVMAIEEWEEERADWCYECTGYGDDYYYDKETGEYVSACDGCPWNEEQEIYD